MSCKRPNDSLRWLIVATLSILIKFFEQLKKQLKKSEMHINFGVKDVGHLIPLSVGHKDKPTDSEINYIHKMIKISGFQYKKEEILETISPDLLFKSSILPAIALSPSPIKNSARNIRSHSEYHAVGKHGKLEKNDNSMIITGSEAEYKDQGDDGCISQFKL
jgi:hypothetical protein